MLQNTNKLNELIKRTRQHPDRISPVLLEKLNNHLQATGQETIQLPWAEQTRQPFPASPWQDQEVETTPPNGTGLEQLKKDYKNEMLHFASNPELFTTTEHSRMFKIRALISLTEASNKL